MTARVAVDVGNTRVKWGLLADNGIAIDRVASLPPDDPVAWDNQLVEWKLSAARWALAGVHPARRDRFAAWVVERGEPFFLIENYQQVGIDVRVDAPERVGIDRLLNVRAAKRVAGRPAAVADVGTAVTVDLLTDDGAFGGGAIFPGPRLMARSLHEHTALLPVVEVGTRPVPALGRDTEGAIRGGISWAVRGGIERIAREFGAAEVVLTGGDAPQIDLPGWHHRPTLTLEGVALAAGWS